LNILPYIHAHPVSTKFFHRAILWELEEIWIRRAKRKSAGQEFISHTGIGEHKDTGDSSSHSLKILVQCGRVCEPVAKNSVRFLYSSKDPLHCPVRRHGTHIRNDVGALLDARDD